MIAKRVKTITKFYIVNKAGVKVGQYSDKKVALQHARIGDSLYEVVQEVHTKLWREEVKS